MTVFRAKLHDAREPSHREVTLYAAPTENLTFANCGTLTFAPEEAMAFAQMVGDEANLRRALEICRNQLRDHLAPAADHIGCSGCGVALDLANEVLG